MGLFFTDLRRKSLSYKLCNFSDCDLKDHFFDSLKNDYSDFDQWFRKKSFEGEYAYVDKDENRIQAFLYIKPDE